MCVKIMVILCVHVTTTLVPRLHVIPHVTGKEQPVGKARDHKIQTFYRLKLLTLKTIKQLAAEQWIKYSSGTGACDLNVIQLNKSTMGYG